MSDTFERALGEILTRVAVCVGCNTAQPTIALAFSGGLDSSALLHLAHQYTQRHALRLVALHIHHGLSSHADAWLAHAEIECKKLGIPFDARRVTVGSRDAGGTEQGARKVRYAALGEMCRAHGATLLLTAHHLDDQAETVLLQLLRGAGVAGITGMEPLNTAPGLVGGESPMVGRPLLELTRAELEAFVAQRHIVYVEDDSNADVRYARNALRHGVMPALAESFPGYAKRLARSARHAQAAQRLLDEMAGQDLDACADGVHIVVNEMRRLSVDRRANMMRHWFAQQGVRLPATAWLDELVAQLLEAKDDARIRVTHADCEIRRHRGRVFLTPRTDEKQLPPVPQEFHWRGEACIAFDEFGGVLHFDVADEGIDPLWLRQQQLRIRFRTGGEKLKLAPDRPTRTLKQHYQSLNVPAWERLQLPVVTAHEHLLFAAGIGMNWRDLPICRGKAVQLRWCLSAS